MIRRMVPLFALSLVACATATTPVSTPPPLADLASARLVDLTHPLDEEAIFWPNSPTTFELDRLQYGTTDGGFFYSANAFSMPEHGGTHLDAPIHFAEAKWTVDQIPVRNLVGRAVVIDMVDRAAADRDARLSLEDIRAWESAHGRIPEGGIVLLRTGWSSRWPDRKAYMGDDTPGATSALHFPSYGEEAARFLIHERHVAALGVDTASIDHGPSTDFIVHRVAGEANVYGLENLTSLDRLPAAGAWVVALPIKIAEGSGGPARVIAIVP